MANTEEFIKTRPHLTVELEDGGQSFDHFLERIGAVGDLAATRQAWTTVQNDHAYSRSLNAQPTLVRKVASRIKRAL